jgi:hypothetical protein
MIKDRKIPSNHMYKTLSTCRGTLCYAAVPYLVLADRPGHAGSELRRCKLLVVTFALQLGPWDVLEPACVKVES